MVRKALILLILRLLHLVLLLHQLIDLLLFQRRIKSVQLVTHFQSAFRVIVVSELEVDQRRRQTVASCLVSAGDGLDLRWWAKYVEVLGELVEAALKLRPGLRQRLHVNQPREVQFKHFLKRALVVGQGTLAAQKLEKIRKIEYPMEADPQYSLGTNQPRSHQVLRELLGRYAMFLVIFKFDTGFEQKVNRRLCATFLPIRTYTPTLLEVVAKVELPGAVFGGHLAVFITEGDPDLDHIRPLHALLHHSVREVLRSPLLYCSVGELVAVLVD